MYAAIRKYRIDPAKSAELKRRVETAFIPIISKTPGFEAYYVVDAGDGDIASVSVFQDRSGADESTRRAADWVKRELTDIIQSAPQVTAGEVVVHKSK
jgi:hypothetical protein